MSWDRKTAGGRKYYYRCRRENGKSIKEYCGFGEAAERAAREDEKARSQRMLNQQRWECWWNRVEAARLPVDDLCNQTALLMKAVYLQAGYYLRRSEWRKRSN